MYINSYDAKLLKLCKKAQDSESMYVVIDTNRGQLYQSAGFYHTDVDVAAEKSFRYSINLPLGSIVPTVKSLVNLGLLRRFGSSPVYQVTHSGWFNRSLARRERLTLIVTHVLFPVVVTLITELIVHVLLKL